MSVKTPTRETRHAIQAKGLFGKIGSNAWPVWVALPISFTCVTSIFSYLDLFLPPRSLQINTWPSLLQAFVASVLFGAAMLLIYWVEDTWRQASERAHSKQPTSSQRWRQALLYASVLTFLVPAFTTIASKLIILAIDFLPHASWQFRVLSVATFAISLFSAIPLVQKISGLSAGRIGPWNAYSVEVPISPEFRPHAIVLAMSRETTDPRTNPRGLCDKVKEARKHQQASSNGEEPLDTQITSDPLRWVLENTPLQAAQHPWHHSIKSLRLHLDVPDKLKGTAPHIWVFVSTTPDQEPGPSKYDEVWGEDTAKENSFEWLLRECLQLQCGPWSPTDSSRQPAISVQAIDGKTHDINDYEAVESAVKSAIRQATNKKNASRLSIDITAGTKIYSAAAAIAALQCGVATAYIQQDKKTDKEMSDDGRNTTALSLSIAKLRYNRLNPQYSWFLRDS